MRRKRKPPNKQAAKLEELVIDTTINEFAEQGRSVLTVFVCICNTISVEAFSVYHALDFFTDRTGIASYENIIDVVCKMTMMSHIEVVGLIDKLIDKRFITAKGKDTYQFNSDEEWDVSSMGGIGDD